MQIEAQIVADSVNPQGDRLVSLMITFPRFILAELNTHRMLSKNSASSRAIPTKKLLKMVEENPFIPIAWQKEHKGMQGSEYFTEPDSIQMCIDGWNTVKNYALTYVKLYNEFGLTKQIANRLLEPFMWHTVLITGNVNDVAWGNFFELRCPEYKPDFDRVGSYRSIKQMASKTAGTNLYYTINGDRYFDGMQCSFVDALYSGLNKGQAEIHMMALAEAIYDAVNESKPKQLQAGEWHIPFENRLPKENNAALLNLIPEINDNSRLWDKCQEYKVKISTAMAARTSYTVVGDEKEIGYDKLIGIHDRMLEARPFHASPFEHCAKAMGRYNYGMYAKHYPNKEKPNTFVDTEEGWCRNFRGFVQYRHIIESEQVTD